jgi:hypothetical protein
MPHSTKPDSNPGAHDDTITSSAQEDSQTPTGSPVERSRFSQWLASFGLGEMPHPLLTRGRSATPKPGSR